MENTVAVDILLTTYNTNIEYLKLQLDSILNQTYKNFTLIISDDCSTKQEVKEVLQEYEKKDNRIKLSTTKSRLYKKFWICLSTINSRLYSF